MRFAATVRVLRFLAATLFPIILLFGLGAVVLALATKSPVSRMQWNLNDQFAAKKSFVAFPVLLRNEIGLVWIDRRTHSRKLIRIDGADLKSPYISDDGQRLLFVKNSTSLNSREVVRCAISTWQCRVLFTLEEDIQSPIEVEAGNVLLAASKLTERSNGQKRYEHFYFVYYDSVTATVEKLSDLVLPSVTALLYVQPKVYFDAYVPSDGHFGIYSRQFDERKKRFNGAPFREAMNSSDLSLSSRLACSEQCRLMAFLYLSSGWHLVIAASGGVPRTITTDAQGISRPSIVGDDIVVNELFESEYAVTAYRLGGEKEVLERLSNSPEGLEALEHIRLSF